MGNPIPVVVVVLDELPVQTLMNAEGDIDSSRYPGFASLLDDFTWYRNTVTMHRRTSNVLPMILTGGPARADVQATSQGYPNNLFTMLANSHDVWAHEELTDLCGPDVCREQSHPDALERWQLLLTDTSVVTAHVALPTGAVSWLPPLDGAWAGFGLGERDSDTLRTTPRTRLPSTRPSTTRCKQSGHTPFDSSTPSTLIFPGMPCQMVCAMRAKSGRTAREVGMMTSTSSIWRTRPTCCRPAMSTASSCASST